MTSSVPEGRFEAEVHVEAALAPNIYGSVSLLSIRLLRQRKNGDSLRTSGIARPYLFLDPHASFPSGVRNKTSVYTNSGRRLRALKVSYGEHGPDNRFYRLITKDMEMLAVFVCVTKLIYGRRYFNLNVVVPNLIFLFAPGRECGQRLKAWPRQSIRPHRLGVPIRQRVYMVGGLIG